MQRITGAVEMRLKLHGAEDAPRNGIAYRTFTVERDRDNTQWSILCYDPVGTQMPTTLAEQLEKKITDAAWQQLVHVFHGMSQELNADWTGKNLHFTIRLSLESTYGFLKETGGIVELAVHDTARVA